jgi:hypothetical protein
MLAAPSGPVAQRNRVVLAGSARLPLLARRLNSGLDMKLMIIAATVFLSGSLGCAGTTLRGTQVSLEAGRCLTVRAEAGSLWTSAHVWTETRRTWDMPARGPVKDLAISPLPGDGGYVVTFRQGGVAWRGELDGERAARSPLSAVTAPFESAGARDASAQR